MPDPRTIEYRRKIDAMAQAQFVGTPIGNVDFQAATTTASSGGGGLSVSQFRFLYADGGVYTVSAKEVFEDVDFGEDNFYSLGFFVAGSAFNSTLLPVFQFGFEDIIDPPTFGPGVPQTGYRFFFLNGGLVSTGGTFRENIYCKNGLPVVEWLRIS
jgi:hypothetical protein